jgi:hypothetical protein
MARAFTLARVLQGGTNMCRPTGKRSLTTTFLRLGAVLLALVPAATPACGSNLTAEDVCAESCTRTEQCGGDYDDCLEVCARCAAEHCSDDQLEEWDACNEEHSVSSCDDDLTPWLSCVVEVNHGEEGCTILMGSNCQ